MATKHLNLLADRLIRTIDDAGKMNRLTLPGVLDALGRDAVQGFPAIRPHQMPAWHMFLVQLAAMALHRSGRSEFPENAAEWRPILRSLTPGFPDDAPWHLVVDDWETPGFLQPPVPNGHPLPKPVQTPDYLDLLITSKNHDIKQKIARNAEPDDWVAALVSLQTMEGFGGKGNYGIARMNGGSSSRTMMALVPLRPDQGRTLVRRPGLHFQRDVRVLLQHRSDHLKSAQGIGYPEKNGHGLIWTQPWPEKQQLDLKDLDIWFIEICRRIRLKLDQSVLMAYKGNSVSERIKAKHLHGMTGDAFAPVHRTDNKSLTLGDRDFDYRLLVDLVFSGDWELPILAQKSPVDASYDSFALMVAALSRGNSKTDGFKTRILPLNSKVARKLVFGASRKDLHQLANEQIEEIKTFSDALGNALAIFSADGDYEKRKNEHYQYAKPAKKQFQKTADDLFFSHLWERYAAQEKGPEARNEAQSAFAKTLMGAATEALDANLLSVPCQSIYRPRAEFRARQAFRAPLRRAFPALFSNTEENDHAATGKDG